MNLGDTLPPFEGASSWLPARPLASELAGRPVLVHFWSSGCPLCHEGMTAVARMRASFSGRGLVTIAVYQPRTDTPFDETRARSEAGSLMGIEYACAIDGGRLLSETFDNPFSPGYFFFDASHRLRHRQAGNSGLDLLEELIDRAIAPGDAIES